MEAGPGIAIQIAPSATVYGFDDDGPSRSTTAAFWIDF
jgi:hypothetical protein